MAEDKEASRPTKSAPSLLSATASSQGEVESSRILAALEGRAPQAEVKHLAPPRRRAGRWLALALLLALLAGGVTWFIHEEGAAPMMAQAPAPAVAPAAGAESSQPQAPGAASTAADFSLQSALDKPPAVAAIIDEAPPARDANVGRGDPEPQGEATNPLSVLAMTPPPAAAPAPGPTRQAAEQQRAQQHARAAGAPQAAKPASTAPRNAAKPSDTDAALLSALMSYGLPPASPPGTRVYKSDGVFMREMPGSPLAERLNACRKLSFFEGEQCRLRVCAGQWGTAPECPTPQANIEP